MSRKHAPDGVFSITHSLSKKKENENAKVALRLQISIPLQKKLSEKWQTK